MSSSRSLPGTTTRSPRKRRPLSDSPLLDPLSHKKSPSKNDSHSGLHFPKTTTSKKFNISKQKRRQWMADALETIETTDLREQLQRELLGSPQHSRFIGFSMIDDAPALATEEETAIQTILTEVDDRQSSIPSPKRPLLCGGADPLDFSCHKARGNSKTNVSPLHKPPHQVPNTKPLVIAPLIVSNEMLVKLQNHIQDKLRGDLWQNEVRSRLARPLSATVFCSRSEQLDHPFAAAQFKPAASPPSEAAAAPVALLYPYCEQVHLMARRPQRMYQKHVFRCEILLQVRRLAVAIRFFRRVIVPWLIKAFRRRRAAAVKIQRRFRRYFHWKRHVLAPFAVAFVHSVCKHAVIRVLARHMLIQKLRRLVEERRQRDAFLRERQRVLHRWVAKTYVSLFVHTIWTLQWFHGKRQDNILQMRKELLEMEQNDVAVQKEYSTIFATSFGRNLLKQELLKWRASVKLSQSTRPAVATTSLLTTTTAGSGETTLPVDGDVLVRLQQCFQIFDLDGSGTLDLDEFELMLSHLRSSLATSTSEKKRAKLTTAQVRDLFESLDTDGSNTVTCDEFQKWWTASQHTATTTTTGGSASGSLLSSGLHGLVVTGHGVLFWLLGKKQLLEKKFVQKLMVKKAMESAKRALLESFMLMETTAARRCRNCGRRYGLQRDLDDHSKHYCNHQATRCNQWVTDTFTLRKWIREEELRLLDDEEKQGKGKKEAEEDTE